MSGEGQESSPKSPRPLSWRGIAPRGEPIPGPAYPGSWRKPSPLRLGEHGRIGEIRALLAHPAPGVILGAGDDAALLAPESGRLLVATTDAAVEGVHFERAWMDPDTLGARAMAANLSDLAAMGARPRWALLAIALPASVPGDTLLALVRGAEAKARTHGAAIVGGNLSRARELSITITALGDVEPGRALLRSGARAGDEVWVSGDPGLARAGLLALQRGHRETTTAPRIERPGDPSREGAPLEDAPDPALGPAISRFLRPEPRTALGEALAAVGARAAIDLSDGLASDAAHLARESGVRLVIERRGLPLGPALTAAARALGEDPLALALAGGEDYELLVAAPARTLQPFSGTDVASMGLARIGHVEAGPGDVVDEGGRPLLAEGWDHFR